MISFAFVVMSSCKSEKAGPASRESGRSAASSGPHDVKTGSPVLPGAKVGEFVVEEVKQDWGKLQLDHSVTGNSLSIAGQTYTSGLGTHAVSRVKIKFDPRFKTFSGLCGVDDWVGSKGSVTFKISDDTKMLFASPVLKGGMKPAEFSVPVEGLSGLVLLVEKSGLTVDGDHADWVNLSLK